jgi:hypothetical protein
MLNLKIDKSSFWVDLPLGVRFHVKPATPAIMLGARYRVSSHVKESSDPSIGFGEITSELIASIGELSVIEWEGVGNHEGNALECTPENVKAVLLSSWQIAEEFDKQYLSKFYEIENEKNV